MLKSEISEDWISLERIGVLAACLSGSLVLLGESGKVHLRTRSGTTEGSHGDHTREACTSPGERSKSIDVTQATLTPPRQQDVPKLLNVDDENLEIEAAATAATRAAEVPAEPSTASSSRRRLRLPQLPFHLPNAFPPVRSFMQPGCC